jgi:hypothetical protein
LCPLAVSFGYTEPTRQATYLPYPSRGRQSRPRSLIAMNRRRSLEPEMNEEAAEILTVLFDPVIKLFDLATLQKLEYFLLQLAAPLAWNYLDELDPFLDGLLYNPVELVLDTITLVVDIVQIQL